jgi:5-methylcytosine-specific restriction endonuclease McrA
MTYQQKQRQESLDRYYSNPGRCKNCGQVIPVYDHETASQARLRKFCNKSCAASFNNRGIRRNSTLKIKIKKEIKPKISTTSQEDFEEVAISSRSITEILQRMGYCESRGNQTWVREMLKECRIDTSKWYLGKGKPGNGKKRPLTEVMVKNSDYDRGNLKRRIITEGLLKEVCALCGQLPEWKGEKLVLVLDHINGINNDHRLENLRLLCPNCNSQTSTFTSRNKKINKK